MPEPVILADEFDPPAQAGGDSIDVTAEFNVPRGTLDIAAEFDPPPARERAAIVEDAQRKVTDWNAAFRNADSPAAGFDLVKKWAGEKAAKVFKQNASEVWQEANTPLIGIDRVNAPSVDSTPESMRPMQKSASVLAGAYNAAAGFTESMATPFNIATLGTFGALTKAAQGTGRAAKAAEAALAALKVGFGAEMAKGAGEQAGKASVDLANPDVPLQDKVEGALAPLITGGLAILSAHSGGKDAMGLAERRAATNPNAVAETLGKAPSRAAEVVDVGHPETTLSTPVEPVDIGPRDATVSTGGGVETAKESKMMADWRRQNSLDVIESVAQMAPDEFLKWEQNNGGQTGASNRLGIDLIGDSEGISALKKAGEAVKAEWRAAFEEAKVAGPGENVAAENKMQKLSSKEQFFSEAVSAAQGTGSGLQDPAVVAAHEARRVTSEFLPPEGINPDAPVVGLGAAASAEFQPVEEFVTSIKNRTVDAEMQARGQPALMSEAAKDFGATWDDAMKRIDENQNVADDLIGELKEKIRPATNVENAILLHRKIELENAFNKASRNLAENIGTPDSLAGDRIAKQQALDDLLELNKISRATGSEQSAALNTRKLMAAQDYSLTSMLEKRSAAKGDAKLTPEEITQVEVQHQKIIDAEKAVGESKTPEETNLNQAKADKAKADFDDVLESDKYDQLTGVQKLRQQAVGVYDAARNLMTTGEFSFILRQGKMAAVSHPVMTAKALPKAFQALFGDEVTARAIDIQTKSDPMAARAIESGVHFAEDGAKLSAREETLASKLADKIPLLRNFNQAGRVFLNKVRLDLYKAMAGDRQLSAEQGEALAKYVNEATGRGSLGGLEKSAVTMGRIFFAPRYVASRIQYAVGHSMWGGDATTRRIIAKEYAKTLVGLGVYYASLTAAFDALTDDPKDKPVITTDPRSTDFGKVKIGNTRIDPLAGLSQVIVFGARTASGETTTADGKVFPIRGANIPASRKWSTVAARFARSKLHPLPAATVNLFDGTDLANKEATPLTEAEGLVSPLTYMDIYEALEEQDLPPGVAAGLLAMLGEGLQTYAPKAKKQMGVARPEADTKKQELRPAK